MNVAQLIEALLKLPQDLPVYVADWNEEWAGDTTLTCAAICEATEPAKSRDGIGLPKRLTLEDSGATNVLDGAGHN